ncbi:hypothetical protein P3X46_003626 [Hevea brasiliensis]|uniref:Uncharacterized protein n=1 Tax=Hevea brasiliensis TaxID=3981 RepID=A0ABQ9N6U9_HEVBR|nr:uncharacterized protein LOC110645071 isoform X2 [Hevea brasiliensis]KAJ9188254.1 hypothetical protein P3X46_003626 [Hevea brasiliensis]
MTNLASEANHEIELAEEDKEERESAACNVSEQPNSNFLVELNLLIMVLSLFSLSSGECLNCRQNDIKSIKDYEHEAKARISRLQTRRQEIHQVKHLGKQAQRFQPAIKDCRHGRKM